MRTRLAFCLLALCAASCDRQPATDQPVEAEQGLSKGVDRSHAGKPVPDAQLFNAEDEQATLTEASGQPVLVNLWASWCAPCVKELPTLDALSRGAGAPRVIAVAVEKAQRTSVDAFLEEHGIKDVESWRDPEMALSGALGVQVMPTTVYYDSSGREVWRFIGDLDWTGEEATKLLAEGGAEAR